VSILPQLIINSIIAGSIYSLVALGFNLIYGTTKFFNLSHGVLAAVGGYAVFYLTRSLGLPLILSAIVGIIIAGIIGYLIDKSVFQALRKRKASGMVFLVASLGIMTALQAVIAIIFSSQFQTLSTGSFKVYGVFGGVITQVQVIILVLSILIMFGLAILLKFTRFGKAVRAISDDEEVSKIVGINTNKIIGRVFFIGSAIAGLSGILVGLDTGIEPGMGLSLLLKGVIASIIGGIGNVYGGVLGAFLLGFIENFGIWKISGEWKDAIAFGVLLIFLLVRPQGIIKK
jgi:branched-subunit amino acid ABC-type transport system permease component